MLCLMMAISRNKSTSSRGMGGLSNLDGNEIKMSKTDIDIKEPFLICILCKKIQLNTAEVQKYG